MNVAWTGEPNTRPESPWQEEAKDLDKVGKLKGKNSAEYVGDENEQDMRLEMENGRQRTTSRGDDDKMMGANGRG